MTPDVFKTFHDVIRNTITPSWVGSVPHNFGEASAGTPKADEWRTIFTIHLPLCLILLSGTPGNQNAGHHQALDHTMQLVCAVILACARITNVDRMRRYRECLQAYISQLPILYPKLRCESIHHMAFHIYDFLELFGPVHSWWSFPFERLIGQLQRLPTNHRFGSYRFMRSNSIVLINSLTGQLEGTIHQAFLRAANLKRWLARAAINSDCIRRCKALFDKIYGERSNNSHQEQSDLADEDSSRENKATPDEIRAFVTSPHVALHARLRFKGVVYARASTHLGNSLVLFYPGGDIYSTLVPGSIQHIYTVGGKTFFAVRQYHRPSSIETDPFAQWPEFRAQTWSTNGDADTLEEVHVPWVHSHFAQLAISDKDVVVLDLNRT